MLTSVILSRRAVEAGVALDCLPGWGVRLLGRMVHFGVDCPGPLWIGSFLETLPSSNELI